MVKYFLLPIDLFHLHDVQSSWNAPQFMIDEISHVDADRNEYLVFQTGYLNCFTFNDRPAE